MDLKTQHPLLMVTEVVSVGFIVYSTDGNAVKPAANSLAKALRGFVTQSLPPGTGVSEVALTLHGQYEAPRPKEAQPLEATPVTDKRWLDNNIKKLKEELSRWPGVNAGQVSAEGVVATATNVLEAKRRALARGEAVSTSAACALADELMQWPGVDVSEFSNDELVREAVQRLKAARAAKGG